MPQTLFIGADHRGFALKQLLLNSSWLPDDWELVDCGNAQYDPDDDFTVYAFSVAERVAAKPGSRGVLICHSAVGMCIAANKVPGIRAGQGATVEQVREDRQHNDFQVLCLPSEITETHAQAMITAFLNTEFSGVERYARRVAQISEYEQQHKDK